MEGRLLNLDGVLGRNKGGESPQRTPVKDGGVVGPTGGGDMVKVDDEGEIAGGESGRAFFP